MTDTYCGSEEELALAIRHARRLASVKAVANCDNLWLHLTQLYSLLSLFEIYFSLLNLALQIIEFKLNSITGVARPDLP